MQVRKQRDSWVVIAKQSKEDEEKFRTGYEKGEQKWKELNEARTKEEQMVTELKEKLAVCKDDLEVTVKVLSGDITNVGSQLYQLQLPNMYVYLYNLYTQLPTVAAPTKQLLEIHTMQQLEQDVETLEVSILARRSDVCINKISLVAINQECVT